MIKKIPSITWLDLVWLFGVPTILNYFACRIAIPIFFILPAIVQMRRNTTIAIVAHTVFGAFGFLALALGAVH